MLDNENAGFEEGVYIRKWLATNQVRRSIAQKESLQAKMLRNPILWLSYKEHMGDALALGADEGRDKLR